MFNPIVYHPLVVVKVNLVSGRASGITLGYFNKKVIGKHVLKNVHKSYLLRDKLFVKKRKN
jgi:hypothetical protein